MKIYNYLYLGWYLVFQSVVSIPIVFVIVLDVDLIGNGEGEEG